MVANPLLKFLLYCRLQRLTTRDLYSLLLSILKTWSLINTTGCFHKGSLRLSCNHCLGHLALQLQLLLFYPNRKHFLRAFPLQTSKTLVTTRISENYAETSECTTSVTLETTLIFVKDKSLTVEYFQEMLFISKLFYFSSLFCSF